jgi:peptidase A4-like protein
LRPALRLVLALVLAATSFATPAATTSAIALQAVTHQPRIDAKPAAGGTSTSGWAASNWSGYAITGTRFTSVTGSWTVQAVSRTRRATYSSQWVGIDGFKNASLIQTGTESNYASGAARYDAWWEILPAAETRIPSVPVRPGDRMTGSIASKGNGTWTISITDVTTGAAFSTTRSYSGPMTSAEWIEEAPSVGGQLATLAHYLSPEKFDPGTVNGSNPVLVAADGGVMIQGRVKVSSPSRPDSDTDGFDMAYGSTSPAPPAS